MARSFAQPGEGWAACPCKASAAAPGPALALRPLDNRLNLAHAHHRATHHHVVAHAGHHAHAHHAHHVHTSATSHPACPSPEPIGIACIPTPGSWGPSSGQFQIPSKDPLCKASCTCSPCQAPQRRSEVKTTSQDAKAPGKDLKHTK